MPPFQQRELTRSEELYEAALTGPFGGIQSELPLSGIEAFGFADVSNFIFRKGAAYVRPGWTALPPFPVTPGEAILAVADFFNSAGTHIQCVLTATRLLQFVGGNWVEITGPGFTGSPSQLFGWDALNYNLCFSQGVDRIFMWDGIAASYVQSSPNAPHALHMAEIALHLVAIDPAFPQRYYWSGVGDPTDWVSFNAGLDDNVNNLGPINGVLKLGQYGFGFHENGILQIIPTGNGLAPFAFVPAINATQGTVAPYSLDHFDDKGRELAAYLGVDNVYNFDGTSIEPIGDMPIDGRRRLGARSRILADVQTVDPRTIYAFHTYSVNGQVFKAYWLSIPNTSTWVYNYDEGNWTRLTYNKKIVSLGSFFKNSAIRIIDLVGTIQAQNWTPATLQSNNPFEGFLLGFGDGTPGYVDFTNYSEIAATITSGKLIFGDRRHSKNVRAFRLTFVDLGPATFTVKLTSQTGQTETHTFTTGTGTGDDLSYVQEFKLPGLRFTYVISVPPGTPTGIVELTPMYDVGGEQRCGALEN